MRAHGKRGRNSAPAQNLRGANVKVQRLKDIRRIDDAPGKGPLPRRIPWGVFGQNVNLPGPELNSTAEALRDTLLANVIRRHGTSFNSCGVAFETSENEAPAEMSAPLRQWSARFVDKGRIRVSSLPRGPL